MATSPDISNYFEGKGVVSFTPDGGTKRDLGNCLSFRVAPEFETKEHKNFRNGTTEIDVTSVSSKKGTVTLQLDEITPDNLAMFLFATQSTNSAGKQELSILAADTVKGEIELVGANDQGSKYTVTLPVVSFVPTGEFDFIGEDYGVIELVGTISSTGGVFGTVEETEAAA